VPNWLSTHPEPGERVVETQPIAAQLGSAGTSRRNRDDFLRRIDGIVFGDNPEDGIVRGNAFLHPVMRFGLEFPEGWEVMNSPTQVGAQEPGQPHYMLLQLVDQPRGRNAEEIAARDMQSAGFRRAEGRATTINGLDAYVGVYQGTIGDMGQVIMRAAHIVHGRQVFVFAGFAPQKEYEQIDRAVSASLGTFRELSRNEADNVKPNRLDFYTVRAGDTWQSIASRNGGIVRAVDLAIINNSAVNEQPQPGTQIKIVVQG
jgi:predicted Zn-dependent protease